MIHERRTREAQRTAHLARTNAAHKGDVTRASHTARGRGRAVGRVRTTAKHLRN